MKSAVRHAALLGLVAAAALGFAPLAGAAPPDAAARVAEIEKAIAGKEAEPAEAVFKNIRILKGMPAGRVTKIMQFGFSGSLGVDCSHCHVVGEWDKDDREAKRIAREMWGLVGEINERVGKIKKDATVNCTTCHRGEAKPALNLPKK